ncbi:glycosyltransferase family 2 protein [Leptolyngbya sp. O-77]|uniref:glycosyltransferase family 2 protein n=1 Tax=Leptolyngbya sp. O-77 TaxID=1080068 RepID=UPI00074D2A99|nr:glycosyltransferase [Leptolyngbya sp. O-77]BAU44419.1 Chondroitin synthase [Leptolyngbya sp. O-77]
MRTTCIINNFNYGQFVFEAVESALNQTAKFDEIIVVDDASTDQSQLALQEAYAHHRVIQLVLKKRNEGQLSAFNEGFLASTGDIIFFLDADDVYHPEYVFEALNFYQQHPDCDFLFCHYELFGRQGLVQVPPPESSSRDYGFSVISSLYYGRWIGGPTSVISAKRSILSKLLPLPLIDDWRTRADDCLIYGTSIFGARKFFLNRTLVNYRIHGANNLQMRREIYTPQAEYKRALALNRLFNCLKASSGYGNQLVELADKEFDTIPQPTRADLKLYLKIIALSTLSLHQKIRRSLSVIQSFVRRSKFKP